jgi:ArsR family transcriptional regulator
MEASPAQFFHLLADPTRLRALLLLRREGELCVCELTHALGESQPKVSRHLATLRKAGVVLDRRQGQWVYYRLHPDLPAWAGQVLAGAARGAEGLPPYVQDADALVAMPGRPGGRCCV